MSPADAAPIPAPRAAPPRESRYLDHLPAIMRDGGADGPSLLGPFLRAFEDVLSGTGDLGQPGLAEIIGGIAPDTAVGRPRLAGLHRYFEPGPNLPDSERAPTEFLAWLAGWVALSLRADLPEYSQREFVARAVPLYRLRGTRRGLEEVLSIYTRLGVTVTEHEAGFCVGRTATVGVDTILESGAPHFFEVTMRVPTPVPSERARYQRVATEIIEAEKPAHCFYRLKIITPSLQIAVNSRVGVDTLLGTVDGSRQRGDAAEGDR